MRKGSKEAKAWGRKMQRLRSKPKTKRRKTRKRRRSTRKGQRRKTARRAYVGLKKAKKRSSGAAMKKRLDSAWSW